MTSFSRIALSLGLVAAFGGVLMFSIARGQDGAAPAPAAPAAGGTGSPVFKHTIGISPVQTGKKSVLVSATYNVQGGTGNEIYDLQTENIYSLLRQRGAAIPNVLHPLSSAKPSFIVEKLMVISVTGAAPAGGANANANANAGAAPPPQ